MSEWKCGKCYKVYSFDEWILLMKTKAVEDDTDPRNQHGFTQKCTCGYVFGTDTWRKRETVNVKGLRGVKADVSTIFLELNSKFGEGPALWYETMVFPKGNIESDYEWRYTTKAEAEAGHAMVVKALRSGKCKTEVTERRLVLPDLTTFDLKVKKNTSKLLSQYKPLDPRLED
jgi:hypothetical protein